ncbi:hypothetical protein HanXRQr2_Chr11g0515511 [Helianthus annuus]|uniref:Uncharacterized protein n=1 Tax=Helianthus annuus TaxID=4232 RepID=A0A9K3HTP4_HELAN|nr:hypothetical protein HanXRQr2_Chr11g0515511 [Helianthus annuus]
MAIERIGMVEVDRTVEIGRRGVVGYGLMVDVNVNLEIGLESM